MVLSFLPFSLRNLFFLTFASASPSSYLLWSECEMSPVGLGAECLVPSWQHCSGKFWKLQDVGPRGRSPLETYLGGYAPSLGSPFCLASCPL